MKQVLRGEIYYAELDPIIGNEQGGKRPVLIIQNNKYTKNCPTCVVAPITKLVNKKFYMCSHVFIKSRRYLKYDSVVLIEHIRSISKKRLGQYLASISYKEQMEINKSLLITFGLNDKENEIYEK